MLKRSTQTGLKLHEDIDDYFLSLSRFKLWYTVDRPTEGWKYSSGFINAEMIEKVFFPPASDNLVLFTMLRCL